ncbi:DNA mismatch repair protein MutL [Rhizopogon vinicolor AM-OR11-026]|uniref:DNA mismatch repair protein MutL n=1 Tax=Rhizopogon vinicolor AM-OR11-026 TaxID=1314800 RepID=A0A1B7MM93_9AGAM|nr:DNA mismatch repair protein MutL [Rhizopogon vinicolor AM-OR11-026]
MAGSSHNDAGLTASIRAIDSHSVHRITSGQVVIDLQTAVKELVENSLDAGATNIDVRLLNYGLQSIEVVDNGSGIAPKDYESVALKHHTSKLAAFEDLSTVLTFGFRGEALSSLCALSDGVTLTTATANEAPMGTILEMDRNGKLRNSTSKVARQRGTTIAVSSIFKPLPVRRKELERNVKREFGKLAVRICSEGGRKTIQLKTDGTPSVKASVTALWGTKALDNVVDLDLSFDVQTDKVVLRRFDQESVGATHVKVRGLISKFAVGAGRTGSDRQYFFINGRPCNPGKIQTAFNEVYKSFSAGQFPFIVADFILPTYACDVNVSPDKRTIFLHSEQNLIQALKVALEEAFASSRSTFDVGTQPLQQPALHPSFTRKVSARTTTTRAASRPARSVEANPDQDGPSGRGHEDYPAAKTLGTPHLLLDPERAPPSHHQLDMTAAEAPLRQPGVTSSALPLFIPDPEVEGDGGSVSQANHPDEIDVDRTREDETALEDQDQEQPVQEYVVSAADRTRALRALRQSRKNRSVMQARPILSDGSRPEHGDDDGDGDGDGDEDAREEVVSAADRIRASRALSQSRKRSASVSQAPVVQTVLSTKGASWNVGRSGGGEGDDDRGSRKRLRLAERDGRASFRSTLSQFARAGSKVGKTSGDRSPPEEIDDAEEQDELMGDDEAANVPVKTRTKRTSRRGHRTSEGTVVLPDDDAAMDIEFSESVHAPPHPPELAPQAAVIDDDVPGIIDLTGDDLSMTLVDTDANSSTAHSPKDHLQTITLRCDLDKIHHAWVHLEQAKVKPTTPGDSSPTSATQVHDRDALDAANVENTEDNAKASAALSRLISKTDFNKMQVVGQFNLGFIVTRWRKCEEGEERGLDDLFIIDQHAADEKYNFEMLQQTTVIESQRLFRPERLELTAADEILAVENMDVLKRNGFEVVRQGDEGEEEGRLHLVAQPMSKDTVFDMKDLEELIHLMHDRPVGTMVRCSKARAMFAMRACRKNVMLGKALSANRMTSIVQHMSTMDQPWNCPHGRPTMRHVSDLTCFARYNALPRTVDWTAFGDGGA